ncbi:hypothetical protein POSPLADRAFT_1128553 [Postia placenta MAD-698-R-SB12]|uniref:Uncharacterized protein n=1 Tax=Postia placenta MAD-698-R-SB12 TaxID=670580 RepID=A0A1X6NEE5_9APHY|nr:hypothetical protein POSPLADRAFT_1128553 [Postia placenta MAD-698-R-SB12]OSX67015.1 hypothetical protein POSPLADRAFT_1128553 [Postia placenta MAD-698-R-SB12]
MADDERAAKAARARAMLKRRQQHHLGAATAASPTASSPGLPPSRPFSPARSEAPEDKHGQHPVRTASPAPSEATLAQHEDENGRDSGDLFANSQIRGAPPNSSDWLSSLTRVEGGPAQGPGSPPQQAAPSTPSTGKTASPVPSPPSTVQVANLQAQIQDQQRAIASLEAEKASLTIAAEKLGHVEFKVQETNDRLRKEQQKSTDLEKRAQKSEQDVDALRNKNDLQAERQETSSLRRRIQDLESTIEDNSSHLGEQQQTISLLVSEKSSLTSSLQELEGAQNRSQEMERLLDIEKGRVAKLEEAMSRLQEANEQYSAKISALAASEADLTDKCRDQVSWLMAVRVLILRWSNKMTGTRVATSQRHGQ